MKKCTITSKKMFGGFVIFILLWLIFLDQYTKIYTIINIPLNTIKPVFNDWFVLTHVENDGMAFSIKYGGQFGKVNLTFVRIFLSILLIFFIRFLIKLNAKKIVIIAFTLSLTALVGNALDNIFYAAIFNDSNSLFVAHKLFYGNVVDMLYFPKLVHITLPQWLPFYSGKQIPFIHFIFNLADFYETIADIIYLTQLKEFYNLSLKINNYWQPHSFITQKKHIYIQQFIILFSVGILYYLFIINKNPLHNPNHNVCRQVSAIISNINIANFFIILSGIIFIKLKKIKYHKICMMVALILSLIFIILFVWHVNLVGLTIFGDSNKNHILEPWESYQIENSKYLYYFILSSHIILAIIILPLVLLTAFKAIIGDSETHKKLSKLIYPFWLYVALTGPIINYMMQPYLH